MQHTVETIKNKYLGMSKPVKAAFWFTVCSFLQRGISMIATPIFTRLLSTENYGLYSTYLSWETVLMMLVTLSLYKAMMNLYVKYENQEMVLSAVCGLELVLSLTWLIIGISFRNLVAEWLGLSPQLVCCLFASFIFQAAVQCWSLYKRYIYDYKTLVAVTLLSTVVIPSILCAVLNLILNYIFIKLCGYQAAAYTTFFCYALFCFIHYMFYKKVCTEILNGTQLYDVKGLLAISVGVMFSGVVITFINRLLWLKYTILVVVLVALIINRKRVFEALKSVLGK